MEVRTELAKPLSPNRLALPRETTTLRVRESYPSAIQLLAKDAILLDEILDHRHLVTIQPAGHGEDQKMERGVVHGVGSVPSARTKTIHSSDAARGHLYR